MAAEVEDGADLEDEAGEKRARLVSDVLLLAVVGVLVLPILALVIVLAFNAKAKPEPTATNFTYVVPKGTGERLDRGEHPDIIPNELRLKVGDHLVVTNLDTRTHTFGLFSVRAGETIDQPFNQPGTYIGLCSVHGPGGDIKILVT